MTRWGERCISEIRRIRICRRRFTSNGSAKEQSDGSKIKLENLRTKTHRAQKEKQPSKKSKTMEQSRLEVRAGQTAHQVHRVKRIQIMKARLTCHRL